MEDYKKIQRIKKQNEPRLMKHSHVVGIGIGKKKVKSEVLHQETYIRCINIYVTKKLPEEKLSKDEIIPKEIEGIPTRVIEVGEVKTYQDKERNE
ncbi:hypothetical protein [Candidatus Oleimmundimicrobium sp.]|uniref:hypothetical protein n=1 Tax=Candidatus Oleimmundimicrobium sp. TaxID=3060597 RepID=UPI0027275045|nr:hypothetical protein [Candidatus Oleimmundimicrobium sp.]MDO8885994.1 hypothetical protein [Candidatus Oleimmundimicrobium sp.]